MISKETVKNNLKRIFPANVMLSEEDLSSLTNATNNVYNNIRLKVPKNVPDEVLIFQIINQLLYKNLV